MPISKSKSTSSALQAKANEALRILEEGLPANGDGFLGVDYPAELAKLVLLSVPWDATTSYRAGTAHGPEAILNASHQIDAYDLTYHRPYQSGISWISDIHEEVLQLNAKARKLVESIRETESSSKIDSVNKLSAKVNELVEERANYFLEQKKIVGVIGGEHSVPLGLMRALGRKYKDFGILHIDAHFDLRDAYEGFKYSHASIMRNALEEVSSISRLVPVAIRDFSLQEVNYVKQHGARIRTYYDQDIAKLEIQGITFQDIADQIIRELPEHVYVSFDIDGLDPSYCPSTGTPVPGGLSYMKAIYLIDCLMESKRKIIGFDVSEVAPAKDLENEWDANVGARLVYKLAAVSGR